MTERLTSDSLGDRFRKPLYSYTEEMCHSFTCPGMSLHVTRFYQASPHFSTASDKCWDEKAWVSDDTCNIDVIITCNFVLRA